MHLRGSHPRGNQPTAVSPSSCQVTGNTSDQHINETAVVVKEATGHAFFLLFGQYLIYGACLRHMSDVLTLQKVKRFLCTLLFQRKGGECGKRPEEQKKFENFDRIKDDEHVRELNNCIVSTHAILLYCTTVAKRN